MLPTTQSPNNTLQSNSLVRIFLADTDPKIASQIIANTDPEFQHCIEVYKNYYDLLEKIAKEPPNLLIVGKIDNFNSFDVCHECHKLRDDLKIAILSRQSVIDDSFRKLALSKGAMDIITNDPQQLHILFQRLNKSSSDPGHTRVASQSIITGQMMLAALKEITEIGSNYFGALAQGNYWRKSQARIVDEFPSLRNWSVDHFGNISCNENTLHEELTDEDLDSLQTWVRLFIEECERIIVDFREILTNRNLSSTSQKILCNA